MKSLQPIEEEPHEEQQHVGRRGKRKRKARVTLNPFVPENVVSRRHQCHKTIHVMLICALIILY